MTDDLPTRLRAFLDIFYGHDPDESPLMQEIFDRSLVIRDAANRIEQLEAALREVSEAVGDPSAYMIARAALEGKDD